MSDTERFLLDDYAKQWFVKVKMASDNVSADAVAALRDQILREVNDCLQQWGSPVKVRRGALEWECHVVCAGVARGDYPFLVGHAASDHFAGQNPARDLLHWAAGSKPLAQLNPHLATMAVIIFFAEVARGYGSEVKGFESWLRETLQSAEPRRTLSLWQQIFERFTFPLTSIQDQLQSDWP